MRYFLTLALVACGIAHLGADDSTPASSNVPRAEYPRVHPDGKVSFRLKAPGATL